MPDDRGSVRALRRQAQRRRRTREIAAVSILTLLVAIVVVGVWVLGRGPASERRDQKPPLLARGSAAPVVTSSVSKAETGTAAAPSALGDVASSKPMAGGASPAIPAVDSLAKSDAAAVAKAAVDFPGAPALSPRTPSLSHGHPRHKYVAFTFDDGYGFQPEMLELLKQYNARCTTFVIGSWAAGNKPVLRQLKRDGFEIANHTWDHSTLTHLSETGIANQLTRTQRVISSVTGNQAPYLRPPGGATNPAVKAAAARLGYRIVMWDRSFGDSGRGATPQKLYDNVVNAHGGVQPGDVILGHWGSKPTYEALKRVLPELRARGYEFVTISELVADSTPSKSSP